MTNWLNTPLEATNEVGISSDQVNILEAIENYDLWFVVERLEQKKSIPTHRIEIAINEFKKYMALIALGYNGISMVSSEVDEVWHNFILFTFEYHKFCHELMGEFVHHAPHTSRKPIDNENSEKFFAAYDRVFGSVPPIWSAVNSEYASAADCDSGCGHVIPDRPTWLFQADCQDIGNDSPPPADSHCRAQPEPAERGKPDKTKRKSASDSRSGDQPKESFFGLKRLTCIESLASGRENITGVERSEF